MVSPHTKEKSSNNPNLRALAAKTLAPIIQQKGSLGSGFENRRENLELKDRGFFQELCVGSLRHYYSLNAILSKLLSKPLRNKDADVQALLIIGLYQLREMRVPDHAAISETVSASKKLKKPWATSLVNATLRAYQRQYKVLAKTLTGDEQFEFSHPSWLIGKIKKNWPQQWQEILHANNSKPPLYLRVNKRQATSEEYLQQLRAQGIAANLSEHSHCGIKLESASDLPNLPAFNLGIASVQDEAAQLCATLLNLEPSQRVLDACCAPGGKTSHILEHCPDLKQLTSVELEESRMLRVKENLERLQLDKLNIKCLVADATETTTWWDNIPFDRILLDAPCSATGVIRRHPDIKLLRRPDDLDKLAQLQLELLSRLWPLLKPGGVLLYATCSLLPQENENNVAQFLHHTADASELPFAKETSWGESRPVGRQLFPQVNGHDGFYYARLIKGE